MTTNTNTKSTQAEVMTAEEKAAAKAAAAEKHYQEQLAALKAVGLTQEQAEKALAALKPVRQAADVIPDERWNLAKGLCGWMLTPDSDNNTEKHSPFLLAALTNTIDIIQIKKDVEYFLNNSTFANACKKGKTVLLNGSEPLSKAAASTAAASFVISALVLFIDNNKQQAADYIAAANLYANSKAGA